MSRPTMSILINRHTAHVPLCSNEIRDIKNVCTVKLTWTYHHDAVYCLSIPVMLVPHPLVYIVMTKKIPIKLMEIRTVK